MSSIKVYVCVFREMKYIFKFSTNRDSNNNKWLDAVWLHCRDTPLLGRHGWTSAQYHSRSTLDSTPPTSPFDTLQAGKMAPLWGGLQACFRLHQSYNKTRFLYSCCTHHLEVSHFYYSCFFVVVIIVPVNKTIIQTIGTASFFINAVLAC